MTNLKTAKNTELVWICANEPGNYSAWAEFCSRFDGRIWLMIYRECRDKELASATNNFHETAQDLVQDVYMKLVEQNCKALKNFEGRSENSIYAYLGIIAKNVVRNHITKKSAKKRPQIGASMDDVDFETKFDKNRLSELGYISHLNLEKLTNIKEKIEHILNSKLKNKNKQRNKFIFKLYFYDDFSIDEIASHFGFKLSSKRISNLISELKKIIRQNLKNV